MTSPLDEYLETRVMTAQPHQLHLLVLDGAIRFAKRAEIALADNDFEKAHLALSSSRGFVCELISGLEPGQMPELVDQLKALFLFVYRNLVQADINHDVQLVSDSLQILEIHRETWIALTNRLTQNNSQESAAPQSNESQPDSHLLNAPSLNPAQPPPPHQPLSLLQQEVDPEYQPRSWTT